MSTVITTVKDSVGTLTFSDSPRNCLNPVLINKIDQAFSRLLEDPDIASILITADHAAGAGCFCAGMDVKLIHAFSRGPRADAEAFLNHLMAFGLKIDRSPKPVVAYVNGPCFGGGLELALCCDLIIAGPKAQFALPEIKLGIFPGWGGTQRFPRRIGFTQAAKMILGGEAIDVNAASEIGLINARGPIQEMDRLMTEVGEAPHMVLRDDTGVIGGVRSVDCSALGKGRSCLAVLSAHTAMVWANWPLEVGLPNEMGLFLEMLYSPDGQEGLAAFVQKRPPKFSAIY